MYRETLLNETLLEIHVRCLEALQVKGHTQDIVMIPFTGTADGPLFSGRVIGQGMDTQKISKNGQAFLSARYMLEGIDGNGQPCRIFIENRGPIDGRFMPLIVTDSALLAPWETTEIYASVNSASDGVTVRIFDAAPPPDQGTAGPEQKQI